MPTLSTIAAATASTIAHFLFALLVLLLTSLTYRLFFHPLARVPGPKLAAISNVWYAYHARNGNMLRIGKTLHQQYGSAVRVGPNEVWFDSREAFAKIYSATQAYDKSDFYLSTSLNRPKFGSLSSSSSSLKLKLSFPDSLDLLSERDMERYRLQRRLIGPLYSMHNIQKYEGAVDDVLAKVVAQLRETDGAELDLKMWMHIIAVECLSAVVLSYSPGYLKAKNDFGSSHHAYMNWRRKSVFGLFTWAVVAESYSKAAGRLFARLWRVTFVTPAPFKPFFTPVYSKITKRISAALRHTPPKDDRIDLMADLIELHKEKSDFKLTYLKRMAMTNFGAGHETTTSALISAVAMIASRPSVQSRVVAEIRDQTQDHQISIPYVEAVDLAYTQAAIKEAQRLYPVLGMSPSRTVPAGGVHVHNTYFPPGTRVGCNPVSLHRNAEIFFHDADRYRPERWLDSETTRDMERCNLIWGGGARTCPGRNLAQLILYKVVAVLFREFDVQITTLPEDGEVKYYFMAMLTGVRVRFVSRRKVDEKGFNLTYSVSCSPTASITPTTHSNPLHPSRPPTSRIFPSLTSNMTRTQKANNRDHVGLANGTAAPEEHLPRYFGKSGHDGMNPSSTKKQGEGRGNWGTPGYTELADLPYNLTKPKRRSNSASMAAGHNLFKTKFEADDDVVEYDEDIHGPDHAELEKMSTTSSADTTIEEEEEAVLGKEVEERK